MRAGGNGGICDGAAVLDQLSPTAMTPPRPPGGRSSAGWIAHDITADRSPIAGGVGPEELRNARSPKLNLKIVYSVVGAAPLTDDELGQIWPHGTPLWFYIRKEAEHRGGGDRLGPVGGQIVTEVLIGCCGPTRAS
jgi:hypothetical protein